jgi:hypothetical protein
VVPSKPCVHPPVPQVHQVLVYGAEGKLDVPEWRKFSGFLSYSYEVGNAWNPMIGGLFLGDDATTAETQLSGHFPDSQDQRNTVRGRVRYQVHPPSSWFCPVTNPDNLRQVHMSEVNTRSKHDPLSVTSILAFREVADLIPPEIPVILETPVPEEQLMEEIAKAAEALPIRALATAS